MRCPIFHRKLVITGNIFPPGSLINTLMKGDLIKGTGHSVSHLFYGFMMGCERDRTKLQT